MISRVADSGVGVEKDSAGGRRAFLVGRRVYLRFLDESDIGEDYVGWLSDYEVTHYLEAGRFPTGLASLRSYLERFQNSKTDIIFAIVDRETEKFIGTVTLNMINWVHRTVDTGLLIGRKEFWGKGYAFEVWSLALEYAFERLGLRKATAGVIADNVASTVTLKKLGFKVEGTLRQQCLVEGEYKDCLFMGLLKKEFYNCKRSRVFDIVSQGENG